MNYPYTGNLSDEIGTISFDFDNRWFVSAKDHKKDEEEKGFRSAAAVNSLKFAKKNSCAILTDF